MFFIYWLPYGRIITRSNGDWVIHDLFGENHFHCPKLEDTLRYTKPYREKTHLYYFENEPCQVETGDIVFDIGAFLGISSIVIEDVAKKVYAIEPSPRNAEYLHKNTQNYENIEVLNVGAWDQSSTLELQEGKHNSEDSIIDPDDGGTGTKVEINVDTIENIANDIGVDKVDLLKIEAEGVEPEVVQGINELEIGKIVSACNAERHGKTTDEEVRMILENNGYIVSVDKDHPYNILCALPSDNSV
ncbi:hypothetical protein JCM18750_33430 [Halostagnicola bangensis]